MSLLLLCGAERFASSFLSSVFEGRADGGLDLAFTQYEIHTRNRDAKPCMQSQDEVNVMA